MSDSYGASPAGDRATHERSPSVSAVPVGIPSADLLTMSLEQRLVLDRMTDDLGYPFRDIAIDCGMTEAAVRRVTHQFHAMGLTGFGPLYSEDGPGICGKGYWLSKEGFKLQRQMRALIGWRGLDAMRDAAQGIETRSAETERLSPKGESPVPQECAHPCLPTPYPKGNNDGR